MPDPLLAVSLLLVLILFTALSAELSMTNLLVRLELGLTFSFGSISLSITPGSLPCFWRKGIREPTISASTGAASSASAACATIFTAGSTPFSNGILSLAFSLSPGVSEPSAAAAGPHLDCLRPPGSLARKI